MNPLSGNELPECRVGTSCPNAEWENKNNKTLSFLFPLDAKVHNNPH